jgi:hypothetical protein
MKNQPAPTFAITAVALTLLIGITLLAQQDRYTLKVPDGLAFSEFKGYDTWQTIAVSETKTSVKAILGNPTMIQAYKEGVPDNGKLFPDGSKTVKIRVAQENKFGVAVFCRGAGCFEVALLYREGLETVPQYAWLGLREV